MTSKLLSANLGDLHPLFKVMSELRQETPSESLRALIRAIITQEASRIDKVKNDRIRFSAGDLDDSFKEFCKKHGLTPSIMLKTIVLQELLRLLKKQEQQPDHQNYASPIFDAHAHVGVTDHKRHRVGLRVSDSELTQLQHLAHDRGTSVQRLIVQIIRAFLLNTHAFSSQESAELGAINLSLMRIGNNLNQMSKRLHVNKETPTDSIALNDIATCVQQINVHVQDCSRSLQLSRERWRIELRN